MQILDAYTRSLFRQGMAIALAVVRQGELWATDWLNCESFPAAQFPTSCILVSWGIMKLLHVIQSANPVHGGPIEGVRQIARIYKARKIEAELVTHDLPDAPYIADFPLKVRALGPSSMGK